MGALLPVVLNNTVTICIIPLTAVYFPNISEKMAALNHSERTYHFSPLSVSVYVCIYIFFFN